MGKFIPLEKMSKKNKREFYSKQRKDWNGLDPVTRVVQEKKIQQVESEIRSVEIGTQRRLKMLPRQKADSGKEVFLNF